MRTMTLLVLSWGIGLAQVVTGWTSQELPPDASKDLHAVTAVDANTVVVVGGSGTILRSADGGTTWSRVDSPSIANLNAVTFSDAKTGTAVGGVGTILRTEDGGASWTRQSSGTNADICGVAFKDEETGIAVGADGSCDGIGPFDSGFILRTTDRGKTWTIRVTNTPRLWAVTFSDAHTVVAVGDQGAVLSSADAGATWRVLHNGDRLIGGARGMFFQNASSGTAVGGGGGVYSTDDGGVTWENRVPAGGGNLLLGVHFTDTYRGTAVGIRGLILRTTDGGHTWRTQPSGVSFVLRGVSFSNAITGWAVGSGGLLRTTTGGELGPVAVSAASLTAPVAAGSLASLVGARLAMSTAETDPRSPVTTLGGIRLRVRDSAGQDRLAPLLYVSPAQINFQVPPETSTGDATLEIVNAPSSSLQTALLVRSIAPGLFAFADGKGAAYGIRIEPDGRQIVLPPGTITVDERPVYLVAYATGVRNRSAIDNVQATIGGLNVPVIYAGPAGDAIPGLDQINILLSTALKRTYGRLIMTVDGVSANPVSVNVR